ncbi:MAG: fused MFS/spermidine synthase [Rubripirellula sp.]|nr:fused MFS/spermidine synthase [Rubripirellula sp.]
MQPEQPEQTVHSRSSKPGAWRPESIFWFAATTLLGAFLVFQVQPVVSKCVLPWFGGTPAVWTTCMLFFQLLLCGGYVYAHLLRTYLRPSTQAFTHLALLSIAALTLPIEPSDTWKPTGTESPLIHLLWMLTAHVGLPYFVLSSTGPLAQAWLSYHDQSQRVYRLYALSNAGSLAALLSYPFVVEPLLSVSHQSITWSLLFLAFVVTQGWLAIRLLRLGDENPRSKNSLFAATSENHESQFTAEPIETGQHSPSSAGVRLLGRESLWGTRLAWLGLPALASTTLLVVTNHICQDIAVIPLLWVLPLSLYLISFIICFDSPHWYQPKLIAGLTLIAILTIQLKPFLPGSMRLIAETSSYLTLLFGVCLLCHGEVARLKPNSSLLTQYYMLLSAGGAVGGVVVAILCPVLLSTHLELPICLAVVTALTFLMFFACKGWRQSLYDWSAAYRLRFAAFVLLIAPLLTVAITPKDEIIASERNFFGVLHVVRDAAGTRLVHGSTIHGMQRFEPNANEPTTYYGRQSGIGLAIASMQRDRASLRIGVVGLGCGVLATYGRANDSFDMIEINPSVVDIANEHFRFLADTPSTVNTHLGDGRLVLERMASQKFDLLVLDAFSSDAIPAHLLTREAIRLYQERLTDQGVLAVHVSNNHLDLVPLVHRLGNDAKLSSRVIRSEGDQDLGTQHATWVLLTAIDHPLWLDPSMSVAEVASKETISNAPLWTDQYHNVISVLRLW